MAIEKNLIQIQSELQNPIVRDEDLVKYANGENPQVPTFLALMEMNRRKQMEDSTKAFDTSNQKTIKDQLASALTAPTQMQSGLTSLPAGQVNPTAAPGGINMTAAPQGVNMAAPPQQVNPTLNPTQPNTAPIPEMAGGGLTSLPVNHFNADSYAGGGIVAFAGGGGAYEQSPGGMYIPKEEMQQPAEPAPNPDSYQGVLAGLPKIQPIAMEAPEDLTREQAFAGIKENQRLAGVEEKPYAEIEKRQSAMEARQQKAYEQGGLDRLIAQLSAFAKADPAKGFGYAGAVSAEASQVLEREQQALRDKQEAAQIEFHKGIAKEDDAKKRGDAVGIQAALDAQKKAKDEYVKLQQAQQKIETDRQNIAAHIYGTETQREANQQRAKHDQGMLGYYNRMAAVAEETKPTKESKVIDKAEQATGDDPQYKEEAKRIGPNGGLEPGSAEFNAVLQRLYKIREFHYKALKLEPPPMPPLPDVIEMAKKPGWWARNAPEILGGAPSTAVTSAAPPPDVQKILDKYK